MNAIPQKLFTKSVFFFRLKYVIKRFFVFDDTYFSNVWIFTMKIMYLSDNITEFLMRNAKRRSWGEI